MQLNYRVYHLDARGVTKSLHNFMAADDAHACETAAVFMGQSEWPGIELWESIRKVHCQGLQP